jgi:hypothetical protein
MSIETKCKRSMDAGVSEDSPPAKRRILDDAKSPSTTCQSPRTAQFQCFHLLLLQSLYDTEDSIPVGGLDDDSLGSVTNDGFEISDDTVDDILWNNARKFVKERDSLIKLKKDASRVNSVHQEALDYLEEQELGSPTPSTPSSRLGGAWQPEDGLPRSVGKLRSISSPNSLSFFAPQRTVPCSKKSPVKSFTLVAHLLQKKCEEFNASVKCKSDPYAPILQEVEEKIENLEGKLKVLKESNLSKQKRRVEDLLSRALLSSHMEPDQSADSDQFDLKSFMSKLETKLSLWRLLAADLKDVVVPGSS